MTEAVLNLCDVRILGPADPAGRGSVLNFVPDRIRAMDLARLLDEVAGIMVRSGRHCVHSWFNATLTPDSVRVSFGPYNTLAEVDALADHLDSLLTHFR
jgi:cysteine desulfurase/selenocysteine lyase